MCHGATVGDSEQHPKPYQMTWLKIEWKEEDRAPLVSKEELAGKEKAFQTGYHDGNCEDPANTAARQFWAGLSVTCTIAARRLARSTVTGRYALYPRATLKGVTQATWRRSRAPAIA